MHEITIRRRIHSLIDELAGPLDLEAKAAALSDIIETAIIMRAEMEEQHGME